MTQTYEKLLQLAKKKDTFSSPEVIEELNSLLKAQDVNEIKDQDLTLLDDLISILANTDNLYPETRTVIIELQDAIRSKRALQE